MQSKRAIIMLVFSVLAGIAAVLAAARWMGQQGATQTAKVLVANRDLQLGQAVTADMIQSVSWPSEAIPEGAFSDVTKLQGRVVRSSIYKGEPVLAPKLAPEGTKAGLDSLIKAGHRAITVKVNEVVGVAGFLAPGSYVDLLINLRDERDVAVSRVVLERIMVLAVAQEAQRADDTKPKVVNAVTLEVTSEQAEKIDLARNIGTLSLMLRNQIDTENTVTAGIRRQDLFSKEPIPAASSAVSGTVKAAAVAAPPPPKRPPVVKAAAPAAKPAAESGDQVEMIRGLQKATSTY